jgi:hypothetical protein
MNLCKTAIFLADFTHTAQDSKVESLRFFILPYSLRWDSQ